MRYGLEDILNKVVDSRTISLEENKKDIQEALDLSLKMITDLKEAVDEAVDKESLMKCCLVIITSNPKAGGVVQGMVGTRRSATQTIASVLAVSDHQATKEVADAGIGVVIKDALKLAELRTSLEGLSPSKLVQALAAKLGLKDFDPSATGECNCPECRAEKEQKLKDVPPTDTPQ